MTIRSRVVRGFTMLLALGLVGCGSKQKTYPVSGTVKFADGKPLSGGIVEFASEEEGTKGLNARGTIQSDGSFKMKMYVDNKQVDGAVEGMHMVVVIPPPPTEGDLESTPKSPIHERYRKYGESGLTIKVKPSEPNTLEIVVDPPPKD